MRDPFAGSDFSQNSQRLRAGRPAPTEPEVGSFPDGSTSDHESVKETGTTTIGISTTDGVVIATDMRASLGGRFVSNKTVQKVKQIHPTAALTLVGSGNFARGGPFLAINPILGGVDEEGSHVYSIDPAGGVMEDDYTITGSGLTVAYGTLEDRYEEDMSVDEARDAAVTAIKAAAERDTGSGNGVYIAEVTGDGVEIEGHENFEGV
ncbi:proteasome subunit beta [Halobacteriales archaeon QH_3_68_24]|nr:MAG: proteasome subunit beta [Halobacteriales archaeon QH_3_68_24]